MGIVSSMFIHLVLNICWKCRLLLEGEERSDDLQKTILSPNTGFLNTPEATSTPLSPCQGEVPTSDRVLATLSQSSTTVKRKRKSRKPVQYNDSKNQIKHYNNKNEVLSPIEEQLLRRISMARECCTMGIGITPLIRKRLPPRNTLRDGVDIVQTPDQSFACIALDLAEKRTDFRKRGLRL